MRTSVRLVAVLCALALAAHAACGGGGPSAPTPAALPAAPAAPSVLTVTSGETARPVEGATVTVDGRPYTTDAAGEVRVGEARAGVMVDVVAAGFLDRQTLLRIGTSRLSLWPRQSATGLNEHTTAELVYTPGQCCPALALANGTLRRVHSSIGAFTVVLDPRYRGNEQVRAAFQEAVSLAGAASGARVVFALGDDAGTGPRIDVTAAADPLSRPNTAAFVERRFDGLGYITGARVVFVIEEFLTGVRPHWQLVTIVAHELGHVLGLGHSSAPGVMSVVDGRGTNYAYFAANRDFSPAEKLVLDLMYDRRSGTTFPDNDRQAASISSARGDRISCGP